jgi:hypothetical protein
MLKPLMRAPYKATYVLSRVSTDPAYVLSHLCMEPPMCGPAYVLSCLCTEPLCQSRLYSCRLYTVAGLYSVAACTVCSRLYSGRLYGVAAYIVAHLIVCVSADTVWPACAVWSLISLPLRSQSAVSEPRCGEHSPLSKPAGPTRRKLVSFCNLQSSAIRRLTRPESGSFL